MITGSFVTKNNRVCKVTINCNSTDIVIGETEGYYFSDDPITIEVDNDDTFNTIIKTTCKINLVVTLFIPELFTANDREIKITVLLDSLLLFEGYITPLCYNLPYAEHLTLLTIQAQDYLGTLKNHKYRENLTYSELKLNTTNRSFNYIFNEIIPGSNIEKKYDIKLATGATAFARTYISESIFLGEEKDDWNTEEEVLNKILTYFNLHIIKIGSTYYVFNYNNKRTVGWGELVNVLPEFYKDSDTLISIDDVYSLFLVTCNLEDIDEIILEPFNADNMVSPFTNFNKYCLEYSKDDKDKKNDWYLQVYNNNNWVYLFLDNSSNTVKTISSMILYENGNAVYQTELLKLLLENQLTPILVKMGFNSHKDKADNSPEDAPNMTNYMIISVNGSKNDNAAGATIAKWDLIMATTDGIIKYNSVNTVNSLTPTDDEVTNYIVISGSVFLQPAFDRPTVKTISGYHAWWQQTDDEGNDLGQIDRYIPEERWEAEYDNLPWGWESFHYEKTTWTELVNPNDIFCEWYYNAKNPLEIGTLKNGYEENGKYYNTIPPLNYEYLKTSFKEKYGDWFVYRDKDDTDTISKIPILVCQLQIGDKYLVEVEENVFKWLTKKKMSYDELIVTGGIELCTYNGVDYKPYFNVGINPKIGDTLLNTEFDIASNLDYRKGMHIPIKKSDNLSGNILFKIMGPAYTAWELQIRRHPTWFRGTKWWTTTKPLMEYVQNIFIKSFSIKTDTDNANINNIDEKDLVYMSLSNEKSIKPTEDITFDIVTGLTLSESIEKGITTKPKKNYIADSLGNVITALKRSEYPDLTKAEEFYITDYYNEYSTPKLIIETSLRYGVIDFCDIAKFSYFPGKLFHPISYIIDVINNKTKYKFKEI